VKMCQADSQYIIDMRSMTDRDGLEGGEQRQRKVKPKGDVRTSEINRHESVTSGEADSVSQNGARDRVSRAQASTGTRLLDFLRLQTDMKLKVVDVPVERGSSSLQRKKGKNELQASH
jgi:hypothetical protein